MATFVNPQTEENILSNLVDVSIARIKTASNRITMKQSTGYFYIMYRQWRNNGEEVRINRSDLSQIMHCCDRTTTNVIKALEEMNLITVLREDSVVNGRCQTINYYQINWEGSVKLLKDKIFGMSTGGKLTYIKSQISSFLIKHSVQFVHPLILISSKEEDIIYNIYRPNFFQKKQEAIMHQDEYDESIVVVSHPETVNPIEGDVLEPVSNMLIPRGEGHYSSFDESIKECPEHWREWARSKNNRWLKEDKIDQAFEDFREHKIKMKRTSKGKHSNWLRAWDRWLVNCVEWYPTEYKDQDKWKSNVRDNAQNVNIPTSKLEMYEQNDYASYLDTIRTHTESSSGQRLCWDRNLTNESFWDTFSGADYTSFNAFYESGKGAHIMDSKEGWLARWHKWGTNGARKQVQIEKAQKLDLVIPEKNAHVHQKLMHKLGKPAYISWVSEAEITCDENDQYEIKFDNAFKRTRVSSDPLMSGYLKELNIRVL